MNGIDDEALLISLVDPMPDKGKGKGKVEGKGKGGSGGKGKGKSTSEGKGKGKSKGKNKGEEGAKGGDSNEAVVRRMQELINRAILSREFNPEDYDMSEGEAEEARRTARSQLGLD